MTVRPIDLQSMIPQAQELSNLNQNRMNNNKSSINTFVQQQDTQVEKQMNKVNDTKDTHKTDVNQDGSSKDRYYSKGQRKKPKKEKSKMQKNLNRNVGRHIDIKI